MDFLNNIVDGLSSSLGSNIPNAIGALLILIIGIFIAKFLRKIITKLIAKSGIDNSLKGNSLIISQLVGKLVYFLLMIIVFMLALEKLGMTNVLEPIKTMLNGFLGFIPNLIGAGLVGYIGYMLANVISELVGLSGESIQKIVPKLKLPENMDLVGILKKLVFIVIFIPLLITALNILNMEAISGPATQMLSSFFEAIPKVLLAVIILVIFVFGGRFVSSLVKDLLNSLNLDGLMSNMNMGDSMGKSSIANTISNVVFGFIVLIGVVTAVEKLEFAQLTNILDTVLTYAGKVVFGLVIIAIGLLIANLLTKNMKSSNPFVASIVKMAILAIFLAIGLGSMGIADEIINLAFGLTLGTVALTIVLSFGLGGREAAGKHMAKILEKFNKN